MTLPQQPRPGRRSRRAALAAAGAAVALALGACSSGADAEPADADPDATGADHGAITVQLSWIKNAEFAGEFFADSKGYFADAGFSSVTLNAGPGATESIVLSGGADFGLSNAISVGQVVAEEDAPLKIVGTTFQKNPFTILSLKDGADIATADDLKGKKIGVQAGPNEALFDALLVINEIDPAEVTKVPVEYDPSPLVNGEVDGFLAYVTNEAITVESEGNPVTNLLFADNGLPFVAESVVTTEEMIANEPQKVKAFLAAEIRGWKDAVADPEEGARLAVEEYGADQELDMEKEVQQATIQIDLIVTDETKENGLFTISDDLIEQNLRTLAAAGIDLEADDLFDLSLLTELLEEQPDLAK
ncbi:ABC transporter substrate-binding protein [Cellulomonas xiejunii]|uniref:ABC transporter substrate-binding protein n=1 Tax=Cellulomonas xiejunii TaxID=2968083 RepID=UPI001D0ED364|nr:ABC transporter substrate-binding protein [Cellulomonas xiejunii]MCC2315471.1 ABC transporter substrate-binding protein [Cellulomonas xiejunii]